MRWSGPGKWLRPAAQLRTKCRDESRHGAHECVRHAEGGRMNGVHDLGGMHGMGAIEPEHDEPVFHSEWEARAFALNIAAGAWRKWNIDAGRHQIELLPPADYLRMSYYEKWAVRLAELLVKHGLVTREEFESGQPARGSVKATPPLTAAQVPSLLRTGAAVSRNVSIAARFQ